MMLKLTYSTLLILGILIFVISIQEELVNGRTISSVIQKAIIKTIRVDKDEIINCYDIYKKPSLNHPSLHNHTIQMKPSMYPKNVKLNNLGTLQLTQTWHKYGSCPQGTIPIKRNRKDYRSTLLRKHHRLRFSHYKTPNTSHPNDIRDGHEHAIIKVDGNFLGAQTKINLWNFTDVRVLCTYPRMSPLVAISRISPLSKASKRMPHSVYTRTKIVEIGG